MPPQKTTRETESNNPPAQVVTAIAPVGALEAQKQIPFGNDNKGNGNDGKLTLAQVRAKLDGQSGKRYWKSLDELADTPGFNEMLAEEFPRQAGGEANE